MPSNSIVKLRVLRIAEIKYQYSLNQNRTVAAIQNVSLQ